MREDEPPSQSQGLHWKPVLIVLSLLIPCLLLTVYHAQYGGFRGRAADSLLPSASYALVLLLVYLDVVGLVVLLLLLSRKLIKTSFEEGKSKLRTKLVAAFIGFSLIPTVLLAVMASGVINEVISVWFNNQIEEVLKDAEELSRRYHKGHTVFVMQSAKAIGQEIEREALLQPDYRDLLMGVIARKRAEFNAPGVEVFSSKLERLVRESTPEATDRIFSLPAGKLVRQVLDSQKEETSVEVAQTGRLIRAAVPVFSTVRPGEIDGVVVVHTYVPEPMLSKMQGIAKQYTDFRQMKASENPIRLGAYLFIAVITVLLLFSATWFGMYVAKSITMPIQDLVRHTEAVARGNLDVKIANVTATDEIGTLIKSFNDMIDDLANSKTNLEKANQSLMQSNVEAGAVVDTIASGVMSLDPHGLITRFNHAAERILGVSGDAIRGHVVFDVFKAHRFTLFQEAYDRILLDGKDSLTLEGQMEVQGKLLTMGLNLSRMRNDEGKDLGFVLVFEDRTELIKAQKTEAWQEVAQRVAHEIKNPLTPIQLAAQRLRKKFFENSDDFQAVFDQSTNVIVNEVGSLKRMVDEFSKFARMPAPHMTRASLHDVLEKVSDLYRGGHHDVEFIPTFDFSVPDLNLDREQMRRVFVNLFDNAIQAMKQKGRIWVTTKMDWKHQRVCITVADEGPGIPQEDREKLFVPYFSRKRTGTGLGLAIVHRIVTDHNGIIQASNRDPHGALFLIELPVA